MKMAGSHEAAARTSAAAITAATSAAVLFAVAVLVCCGTNGSGSGERGNVYPVSRWKHGGGRDYGDGGGGRVSPPAPQRRQHLARTDEPRPAGPVADPADSALAAAAAAKPWMMPRDGEGGWSTLPERLATRRATVSGGSPSGQAENRARSGTALAIERESESGQGNSAASVLYSSSAPPAHGSHAPHDAVVAKEAGAERARRKKESGEEQRGKGGQAEGGGREFRLRGVRRHRQQRRQQLLSDVGVGEERVDDEQQEARGIAPAVVAEEEGARHEGGGVLEGRMGRFLSKHKAFDHPPDRCFVANGEEETRCHANIFFFGVSKCGTTSLAHWMAEHPGLRWVTHPDKRDKPGAEAHVMERVAEKDHASAYALTAPEAEETDPVVDYTPHYSILADVPYKILHMYGKQAYDGTLKYVVALREPAARTISSWQFKFDLGGAQKGKKRTSSHERRTLEWVFAEGRERVNALAACLSKHLEPGSLLDSHSRRKADVDTCNPKRFLESNDYFSHVGKSVYVLQLRRWVSLFGQENVKVIFLEEMAAEPVGTLSSVFDFLGMKLLDEEGEAKRLPYLGEWEDIVRRSHNLAGEKKKKILDPQATPELVQSMRDYFAPFNAELRELLGRPLPENWSLPPDSRV